MTPEERQCLFELLIADLVKVPLPEDAVASFDCRLLRTYFERLVACIRAFDPDAANSSK